MIEVDLVHDGVRLVGLARDEGLAAELPEFVRRVDLVREVRCERRPWAGNDAWLKSEPLASGPARRHRLRARFLGRPYPRRAEFENLAWLRSHGFGAPEPLVACVGRVGGRALWQFLVTSTVQDATDLRSFLERRPMELGALLDELGQQVAALHALGFVHRDLFPRNLLLRGGPERPELFFLDAWRGGARPQLRAADHDLACLFLHLPLWLERGELERLFEAYLAGRARHARAPNAARLARRIERGRRGLIRRLEAEPGRLRGLPLPEASWRMPGAGRS
jgi:tRNA A-37 threonylcarbamoyl transferase component Bud32